MDNVTLKALFHYVIHDMYALSAGYIVQSHALVNALGLLRAVFLFSFRQVQIRLKDLECVKLWKLMICTENVLEILVKNPEQSVVECKPWEMVDSSTD